MTKLKTGTEIYQYHNVIRSFVTVDTSRRGPFHEL